MGCCIKEPQVDDGDMPNNSKVQIIQEEPPIKLSVQQANTQRQKGKKYFNAGKFEEAAKCYQLAVINDPMSLVNYTNLALAQKALHQYEESISTINKMEAKKSQIKANVGVIAKGRILKARCQSIIAKNYCLTENPTSGVAFDKNLKMINESVNSLRDLLQHQNFKESAKAMNTQKYLQNSLKIRTIFSTLKQKHDDSQKLLSYLQKRLKSKQSESYFKTMQMKSYVKNSQDVLTQIRKMRKDQQKLQLDQTDEEQQQFTIDPITYEQYVNPILVQSGLTYQQSALKSHYEKNGSYDPITKQKFTDELGVKNRTLIAYINQTKKVNTLKEIKNLDL